MTPSDVHNMAREISHWRAQALAAEARADAAEKLAGEMAEALEPFADWASVVAPRQADEFVCYSTIILPSELAVCITAENIRTARAARDRFLARRADGGAS